MHKNLLGSTRDLSDHPAGRSSAGHTHTHTQIQNVNKDTTVNRKEDNVNFPQHQKVPGS